MNHAMRRKLLFELAEAVKDENGKRIIAESLGVTQQAVYQVLNPTRRDSSQRIVNAIDNYIKINLKEAGIHVGFYKQAA